ncbi:MAG TPA: hypothetical protein VE988_13065 [Gemmataceae bacterium]|nr:hypothetical protein [Gemmataceae bacterium]
MPIAPEPVASLECLLSRLHPIHALLTSRRFSDAVASQAVDEVLEVGRKALASGKAAQMTEVHRAGWIWKVAITAACRAARKEPAFVALTREPAVQCFDCDDAPQVELNAMLLGELDKLCPEDKQAVVLRCLENLSLRSAGRAANCPPSTIAYRYDRAIARLRAALTSDPAQNA